MKIKINYLGPAAGPMCFLEKFGSLFAKGIGQCIVVG